MLVQELFGSGDPYRLELGVKERTWQHADGYISEILLCPLRGPVSIFLFIA